MLVNVLRYKTLYGYAYPFAIGAYVCLIALSLSRKAFLVNRLSLIQRSNSSQSSSFLIAAASLPTKYLVLGFSDLIAPKMTSATAMGQMH